MGLLDIFRKNKSNSAREKDPKQNNFLTNTTDFGFDAIELGISSKLRVDCILAIAKFQEIAEQKGIEFSYSVMYISLLEEGALTVPLVMKFGRDAYTVYFIYTEDDLLKYKDLQQRVDTTAYPKLMYFSSIPIYEGYEPKKIVEPFQLADLRVNEKAEPTGTYGMWWKSEEEIDFSNSETHKLLTQLYDVFQGYETYLLGYLIRQLRITEDTDLKRMNLPENGANYVVDGPEDKKIILDISQEKGMRFLFPIKQTTKEYRERFLKGVVVDFLSTRLALQQNNLEKDEVKDPNSHDWFTFMVQVIEKEETENEGVELVGGLNLDH